MNGRLQGNMPMCREVSASRHSYQHLCRNQVSVMCDRGDGKPKRKRCSRCGSTFLVFAGQWAAFHWTGENRYPESAALTIGSKSTVERFIAQREGENLVARFIRSAVLED